MPTVQVRSESNIKHAEFQSGFIWTALALAFFAGFAIGAHMVFVIGFDFDLGPGFASYIQLHGHLQLMGWVGLFIIGISLYFLPRLARTPLRTPHRQRRVLALMAAGLILRAVVHSIIPYLIGKPIFAVMSWMLAASAVLEWGGIALYLTLLVDVFRRVEHFETRPKLWMVAPFFVMMLVGWFGYATLNLVSILTMLWKKAVVADQAWNEFGVQVFIGFVLLPVTFAFSLRTFPLYLRLRAPTWPVRRLALLYLSFLCLQLLAILPPVLNRFSQQALLVATIGMILKSATVLWFIWELDILFRRKQPWTVERVLEPAPNRRPTRAGLPDYGEFGRFERLLYAAYVWLAIAALFEILSGVSFILGHPVLHSTDAIRHMYLLGFVSNLIFGMAARMLPGFMHKKRIFSGGLVDATFWLVNTAAVGRVLPLMLPPPVFLRIPASLTVAKSAFALSGVIAMLAVLCLAVNLWQTQAKSERV